MQTNTKCLYCWTFKFVRQKTETEVTIPILNDNLIALFEKYNYNVTKANEQVLNRYIKNILKDLSETVPSLKEKVSTKLSHKYTILQMMHVSGHKTQKTFMDYIKQSSEEIAHDLKWASINNQL